MKYIFAIIAILALIFGVWYAASPYIALSGLHDAAAAGDAKGIEEHVDFASLRASVKSEFKARLSAEAAKEDANPLLATVGLALADRMVDGMLDNMMTPSGIAKMIKISQDKAEDVSAVVAQDEQKPAVDKFDEWEVERIGLSEFRLSNPNDRQNPELIFQRDGLGWKLSNVDMTHMELPLLQ